MNALRRWLSSRFNARTNRCPPVRPRPRFRPELQLLEDRTVPSVYTVTSNQDTSNFGTLRWAIGQVNTVQGPSGDLIQFASTLTGGQTITLQSALTVNAGTSVLTISGVGSSAVTISGNSKFEVLNSSRALTLESVTIANGKAANGGGILGTTVIALNCTFSNNQAQGLGGAIDATSLTATNCAFTNNSVTVAKSASFVAADGGAVYVSSALTVNACTFSGNKVSVTASGSTTTVQGIASGGAIYSTANPCAITNSTFTNNVCTVSVFNDTVTGVATSTGGALTCLGASVINCTFYGNSVTALVQDPTNGTVTTEGGAILGDKTVAAINTIFASNQALDGGGIWDARVASGTLNASNCLFFSNTGGDYHVSTVTQSACLFATDPKLGTLQANGGPTSTMALQTGSLAIDAGTTVGAPLVDQRGYVRDAMPDIGAYEVSTTLPVITPLSGSAPQSTTVNTAFANPLGVTVTTPAGTPIPNFPVFLQGNLNPFVPFASAFFNGTGSVALTTNSTGTASTPVTANTVAGPYTITTIVGPGPNSSFSLTNNADVPNRIFVHQGSGQSATVNTTFGTTLQLFVMDRFGNPINGGSVTFSVTPAGNGASATFTPPALTDTDGQTNVTATANTIAGSYTVTASVGAITGMFTLTNVPDVAALLTITPTGTQSATVATAFATALQVAITDQYGNPIPGLTVAYAVTPATNGAAASLTTPAPTDGNGQTNVTATANTIAGGPYLVTASFGSLSQSFTLINLAGVPAFISASPNSTQSTLANTRFANPLQVTVTDQYGNPVGGVPVAFNLPASGASGTLSGGNTGVTDSNGQVSKTLTANLTLGNFSVRVTATGGSNPTTDFASFINTVSLDVDGNGTVDPLTDGILILRYLFHFSGAALTGGAIGPGATRTDSAAITSYLAGSRTTMLDVDGDGSANSLTDGILLLRYMFAFTGSTLTTGAVGAGATRKDAVSIQAFAEAYDPSVGHQWAAALESGSAPMDVLTAAELQAITRTAIERWENAGISAAAMAALENAHVQLASLGATVLGETKGDSVLIDIDGAGNGWFVDPTPLDDTEFTFRTGSAQGDASPGGPATNRMDLLTVVMHELGLVMGLEEFTPAVQPYSLMTDVLAAGVRRLPA